jgi:hypothetical protein
MQFDKQAMMISITAVLAIVASTTQAAPVVEDSVTNSDIDKINYSVGITVPAGGDMAVLVGLTSGVRTDQFPSAVSYNGVEGFLVDRIEDSVRWVYAYYVPLGVVAANVSASIDVTSDSNKTTLSAIVLSGAPQTADGLYTAKTDTGDTSAPLSTAITASSGDVLFDVVSSSTAGWSPEPDQTAVNRGDADGHKQYASYKTAATTGETTMSWVGSDNTFKQLVVGVTPEPATISLLGIGGLVALRRRR